MTSPGFKNDDAGVQGYSISGVGNQGIFLTFLGGAGAGVAQSYGLLDKVAGLTGSTMGVSPLGAQSTPSPGAAAAGAPDPDQTNAAPAAATAPTPAPDASSAPASPAPATNSPNATPSSPTTNP
jgi:predicted lipid-binding transport protein (Tim44 family)